MDFPDQMQVVNGQSRQPFVLEIDMDNPSQRNPVVHEALHAGIGDKCLARPAHALDNRRGAQFLGVFHIARDDSIWNPVVVELAHD